MKLTDSIITWTPAIADTGTQTIKIMASDNKGHQIFLSWKITVIWSRSTEAHLDSLKILNCALLPIFNSDSLNYTSSVPNTIANVTVSTWAHDTAAVVTVNGLIATNGVPSSSISLSEGTNQITVMVTAQDTRNTKQYKVLIIRQTVGTQVSGRISANTTWFTANSPYHVIGSIIVDSGVTLTIEPGATILFDSAKALVINGEIVARGTASQRITFTSNFPLRYRWAYILINPSCTDASFNPDTTYAAGCVFEYCKIEYAGVSGLPTSGALTIQNAIPYIAHCQVSNNSGSGIYYCNSVGMLIMSYCDLVDNVALGLWANKDSSTGGGMILSDCSISRNGWAGMNAVTSIETRLTRCVINGNGGLWLQASGNVSPSGAAFIGSGPLSMRTCILSGNYAAGFISSCKPTIMSQCTLTSNNAYRGGGAWFMAGVATIDSCDVSSNTAQSYIGGVWINGADVIISNSRISGNKALGGGGWEGYGGGIHIDQGGPGAASLRLRHCSIDSNTVTGRGGAIATSCYYGGTVSLQIDTCKIFGNYCGTNGGAVYSYGALRINGSLIANNSAARGSAIYANCPDSGTISYNTISGNTATGTDSVCAVFVTGKPMLTHNNFSQNTGGYTLWNSNPQGSANLISVNNWWGTANSATIDGMIYDMIDDGTRSLVDFAPFLTAPDPNCPILP